MGPDWLSRGKQNSTFDKAGKLPPIKISSISPKPKRDMSSIKRRSSVTISNTIDSRCLRIRDGDKNAFNSNGMVSIVKYAKCNWSVCKLGVWLMFIIGTCSGNRNNELAVREGWAN